MIYNFMLYFYVFYWGGFFFLKSCPSFNTENPDSDREMCGNCEKALFGEKDPVSLKIIRKGVKDITPNITVQNTLPSIYKANENIPTLKGRVRGFKNYNEALN